jgi:ATP phosphoribosyltransferase
VSENLVIGIPSKGRLQENANAFFARAGLAVLQPGGLRNYRGRLSGLDNVEVAFLSAAEIAGEIAAGTVHLGVTGRDQIEESIDNWSARTDLVVPLGFGFCDVVVAVPAAWIDVHSIADLDDVAADFRPRHGRRLKVATKYVNLTRRFFAIHGIADYRIVESLGATEGAPATGAADLVVDITTTGATLRANGLKTLEDGLILASEAYLAASLTATWSAGAKEGLRILLDRIEAEAEARRMVELQTDARNAAKIAQAAEKRFSATRPYPESPRLILHCPSGKAAACADWLRAEGGASVVTSRKLDAVYRAESPLFDRLSKRIEQR